MYKIISGIIVACNLMDLVLVSYTCETLKEKVLQNCNNCVNRL